MLTFSFFATVFISIMWLIYVSIYLSVRLAGIDLTSLGLMDTAIYTAIIFLPLAILWSIWGRFYNLSHEKKLQKQLQLLSKQITQNQEYSEVMARILLKNSQQQVHSFALSKVDLYISEMNEILSDVLQRYEFLDKTYYSTVIRTVAQGNRWGFAKAVVDLYNKDADFQKKLTKSARAQPLLAGSITEFCANYTRLLRLLKDHDEDNILQEIIETGALGKAFAIFAPVVRSLHEPEAKKEVSEIRAYRDEGPELQDDERFFKDDNTSADNNRIEEPDIESSVLHRRPTVLKKIFNRIMPSRSDTEDEKGNPDAFTMALERSFSNKGILEQVPSFLSSSSEEHEQFQPTLLSSGDEQPPSFLSFPNSNTDRSAPFLSQPEEDNARSISSILSRSVEQDTDGYATAPQAPKFTFDNTNRTIKSLQKEWEDMKKSEFSSISRDKVADE